MTAIPTDALRLVPVETLRRCAAVLADPKAEHSHDVSYLIEEVEALAAASASPLPEGGGMTVGERAFTAWAGSSRADGTPLMWTWDEMHDEQKRRWDRIADAVLAPLPAAPTGHAK